jgi:L-ascorbate metabolism protein UlaG (beta-lactamase superfamily)
MNLIAHTGTPGALLRTNLPPNQLTFAWLGQAGFLFRLAGRSFVIDPYLSDSLARKYGGTELSHQRMMPPPIQPDEFHDLNFVLCTHGHGDHMDPDTLTTLAGNNPECRFVIPRAEMKRAAEIGLRTERLMPLGDGERVSLCDNVQVEAVASAHEKLETDDKGNHKFLGFILQFGETSIYHSGDCVVYEGLTNRLRHSHIDLAMLPVNGRSKELNDKGIVGNMNFEEAAALCLSTRVRNFMPVHFDMFDFNTVPRSELSARVARLDPVHLRCLLPDLDHYYTLAPV